MQVSFALFADAANLSQEGKLNILGVFDAVQVGALPTVHRRASLVVHLKGDESDAGIVHAIVNLGRALHLGVIAEGVETEDQRAFLESAGCRDFQGFLCAPALAPDVFEARFAAATGEAKPRS